jgi:hypothetical protein
MTDFRRVMFLFAQSKHSHLGNNSHLGQHCIQRESSSKAFTTLSSMLALALMLVTAPTVLPAEAEDNDRDQGGHVLPAAARPHGYSLERMASLLAFFNSTGNHLLFYPFPQFPDRSDPFQILYLDAGLNPPNFNFKVYEGTMFFVSIFGIDDSPPIIGNFPPYPSEPNKAAGYFLNRQQLGGHGWVITVDGHTTSLGPEFFVGPVLTPPLADAPPCQGGTHFLQFGVFLTPLRVGNPHTIRFQGVLDGVALLANNNGNPFTEDISYNVQVIPNGLEK